MLKFFVVHCADVVEQVTMSGDAAQATARKFCSNIFECLADDYDDAKWIFRAWWENKKNN